MRLLISIICIIFLLGCGIKNNEQQQDLQAQPVLKDSIQKKKDSIPISSELPRGLDTTIDESSRFIAGLPMSSNRLRGIANYGFYSAHAKRLQELFRRVKSKRLKPMSDFSQAELASD
ncbi:MAG: hypothetical protein ACKO2H_09590, partial [Bacteroidota bacterium]